MGLRPRARFACAWSSAIKIKAVHSNDPHDWACFKKTRNVVNVAIRQAKELSYKNKFSKSDGDPRKTWQVNNELTFRKTGRSSVRELSLNGVSITNSTTLSNAFNDHFSIGSKLASEIHNNNNHNNNNGNFICVFDCTIVSLATYRQFTNAA